MVLIVQWDEPSIWGREEGGEFPSDLVVFVYWHVFPVMLLSFWSKN
jgi:hypothetical protein